MIANMALAAFVGQRPTLAHAAPRVICAIRGWTFAADPTVAVFAIVILFQARQVVLLLEDDIVRDAH